MAHCNLVAITGNYLCQRDQLQIWCNPIVGIRRAGLILEILVPDRQNGGIEEIGHRLRRKDPVEACHHPSGNKR
ncbi:hypothetical protein D3C77_737840 [compost metagenome]